MIASFKYTTRFLEGAVRQHKLLTLEEAVAAITNAPAELYGLRDRGRLERGAYADVVIFDESTVGPGTLTTRFDLPGQQGRLYSEPEGISHVFVNGTVIVDDGHFTGVIPGTLLRSGLDTHTRGY